jgi:AraC-like DNA-binding protein
MEDNMKHCVQPEINIYYYAYVTDCSYWTFNNVSAPYWRFYWNATPGGEIFYKGKSIILKSDSIILIPPNTCFSTKAHAAFEQFHVHFVADYPFDHVCQDIYTFPISEDVKEKIMTMKKLMPEKQDDMHFKLMLFSLIYDGLLKIPKNAFMADKPQYDSRIVKIIELLDKNTSWVFSNEELAEKVNMSRNGFIRLFSTETGISPLQYSRSKRIEKACLLLHFSEQSIDDIALKTGFQDRYYFSRVFKQITNNSPVQFRKAEKQ